MARPESYHGSSEELRKIREKRNEEVRAWGRQQLADADALLGVPTEPTDIGDWEQISAARQESIRAGVEQSHAGMVTPAEEVLKELEVEEEPAEPVVETPPPTPKPKTTRAPKAE